MANFLAGSLGRLMIMVRHRLEAMQRQPGEIDGCLTTATAIIN